MVFINLITTTHVNKTVDRPLMNSMAVRRYKNENVVNQRGRYQEPSIIIKPILDHKDGHYVTPNRVALKCPNFKKDVNPNANVKMFNFVVKANAKTFEEYIINAFSYTLRNTTSD